MIKKKKEEGQKKGRMILKYLIKQRIESEGFADALVKGKEKKRIKAEKESLGNFEKARKVFRSPRNNT